MYIMGTIYIPYIFKCKFHTFKCVMKIKLFVSGLCCSRRYPVMKCEQMEAFTEEDTKNIVHRTVIPQSPSK